MSKKKMKTKTIVILLAMAAGVVLSPPMVAQNDGSRGLFGRGGNNDYANRSEVGASGLLNQGFGLWSNQWRHHQPNLWRNANG